MGAGLRTDRASGSSSELGPFEQLDSAYLIRARDRQAPWSRLLNRGVQYGLDVTVLVSAFVLAYLLRFEFSLDEATVLRFLVQLPFVVFLQFSALFLAGVYAIIWRYIGLAELRLFLRAAFWPTAILFVVRYLDLPDHLRPWSVPRSIIVMDALIAFLGVLSLRVLRRFLYERYEKRSRNSVRGSAALRPVLLVGAGRAGVLAAKEILGRGDLDLEIKGFVDDDSEKLGMMLQGFRVIGATRDIPRLVAEHSIDHVIITIARASRPEIRRIVEICDRVPIRVRIIPGFYEILSGQVEVSGIRDVQIEDLLGREEVHLDDEVVARFLKGRVALVTGAGGSIGSELCRQICKHEARQLLLVERAEFALFEIDRELQATDCATEIIPLIADVGDEGRMRSILETYRPDVLVHAAAHKHVPLMELNPAEALKNNVVATHGLARLAGDLGVESFVQISTDKAVRPSSIMGATKRFSELLIQGLDRQHATRFVSVRFGNVLGSAGSVIQIFREQIANGGPVTVTHPDMVRYFMTIPEAVRLVLQAGAMGQGGEIFVLDMGEPVRILDVAMDMIRLSGLRPFEDIDIVFTGIRPGEKLFEELQTDHEAIAATSHPKIFIGKITRAPNDRILENLEQLQAFAANGRDNEVRALLRRCLSEGLMAE